MNTPSIKYIPGGKQGEGYVMITQEDFVRAREALIKADVSKDHKLYLLSDGRLVAIKDNDVKVLNYET